MENNNSKINRIDKELLDIENYLKAVKKENKLPKNKKINKKIVIIILILVFVSIFLVTIFFKDNIINEFIEAEIKSITLESYDKKNKKILITIDINSNIKYKKISCYFIDTKTNNKKYVLVENNKCVTELDLNDYTISLLSDEETLTKEILLSEKINNILELKTNDDKVYLAIGNSYKIPVIIESIGKPSSLTWSSSDSSIATVDNNGTVIGNKDGVVTITAKDKYNNEIKVTVVVTSLINRPHINNNKSFLPCKIYNSDQARLLDEILFDRVADAGKGTRAGVVAAARFLSLEFPYRIQYFLENGRLNPENDRPYADGEGRFYHEGLYLSTDKYSIKEKSVAGPAIWGCKIREYSYEDNRYTSNGLDCSGFVTWSLKNGGYDFGDLGSIGWTGNNSSSITWFGDLQYITMDLLKSGKVKAGDLASVPGHVAIVVGIDDNHVYIAEELYHNVGLTVVTFTYEELVNTDLFTHLVLMDKAYINDGNYANMW